ncbi:MAG: class I SAM-dependent methyltransferase [Holosporales bacterium]|jgi:SAM-dependent methyltransferase|nr:class I SAM-dependent methyltransferase [Holosporales bacterium]
MRPSAQDLSFFYASPLGRYVATEVSDLLKKWLSDLTLGKSIIGLGYASPYWEILHSCSDRKVLLMIPPPQGAEPGACLVHEEMLPLADNSCEAVFLMHCLEFALDTKSVLRDVWRVLVPGGYILIIVPNIYGLWAHFDVTPFSLGQAFSESNMRHMLEDSGFSLKDCTSLLSIPWLSAKNFLHRHSMGAFTPTRIFPGLLAVRCVKSIYCSILSRPSEDVKECQEISVV